MTEWELMINRNLLLDVSMWHHLHGCFIYTLKDHGPCGYGPNRRKEDLSINFAYAITDVYGRCMVSPAEDMHDHVLITEIEREVGGCLCFGALSDGDGVFGSSLLLPRLAHEGQLLLRDLNE